MSTSSALSSHDRTLRCPGVADHVMNVTPERLSGSTGNSTSGFAVTSRAFGV